MGDLEAFLDRARARGVDEDLCAFVRRGYDHSLAPNDRLDAVSRHDTVPKTIRHLPMTVSKLVSVVF